MHVRLIIGGWGYQYYPKIHSRFGYNFDIDDAIKDTDTAKDHSEWWLPRHPTVLLNVTG